MLLGTLGLVLETFLARVLLAPALGPVRFGYFLLGLALAGLIATFGALGLPQTVARSLPFAKVADERRGIVRESVVLGVATAAVASGGLILLGFYIGISNTEFGLALIFFGASLFFSLVSSLIASIFQGHEDVYPNALFVQILNPLIFLAFLAAFWLAPPAGLSFTEALTSYLIANVITLVGLTLYAQQRLRRILPRGPRALGVRAKLLAFALPLFIVGIFSYVTQNGDTLLLGIFHINTVGLYGAPLTLARLLQVGLGSLAYIFLPVTSRFVASDNPEAVRTTYTTVTKWTVLTSLPLFLVFFFLPAESLGFVFGHSYIGETLPLQILVVGAFLSVVVGPAVAVMVSTGRTRLLTYNTIISAATDVVLSLLLIPPLGVLGAAIAWATANALFTTLAAVEIAVLDRVHPFQRHYVVPLLATGIPLAIALVFVSTVTVPNWGLVALVLGIALVFVLLVVVTGSIDDGDRLLLEVVENTLGRRLPLLRRFGRWGMTFSRSAPP